MDAAIAKKKSKPGCSLLGQEHNLSTYPIKTFFWNLIFKGQWELPEDTNTFVDAATNTVSDLGLFQVLVNTKSLAAVITYLGNVVDEMA